MYGLTNEQLCKKFFTSNLSNRKPIPEDSPYYAGLTNERMMADRLLLPEDPALPADMPYGSSITEIGDLTTVSTTRTVQTKLFYGEPIARFPQGFYSTDPNAMYGVQHARDAASMLPTTVGLYGYHGKIYGYEVVQKPHYQLPSDPFNLEEKIRNTTHSEPAHHGFHDIFTHQVLFEPAPSNVGLIHGNWDSSNLPDGGTRTRMTPLEVTALRDHDEEHVRGANKLDAENLARFKRNVVAMFRAAASH